MLRNDCLKNYGAASDRFRPEPNPGSALAGFAASGPPCFPWFAVREKWLHRKYLRIRVKTFLVAVK